jgi:DNA-binding transcriptional ArsR family regulator
MTDERFFAISKALADPQRFRIFQRIAQSADELACKALTAELDVTPATISHHLKELGGVGLVSGRKEAQCMFLTADRAAFHDWQAELARRVSGPRR